MLRLLQSNVQSSAWGVNAALARSLASLHAAVCAIDSHRRHCTTGLHAQQQQVDLQGPASSAAHITDSYPSISRRTFNRQQHERVSSVDHPSAPLGQQGMVAQQHVCSSRSDLQTHRHPLQHPFVPCRCRTAHERSRGCPHLACQQQQQQQEYHQRPLLLNPPAPLHEQQRQQQQDTLSPPTAQQWRRQHQWQQFRAASSDATSAPALTGTAVDPDPHAPDQLYAVTLGLPGNTVWVDQQPQQQQQQQQRKQEHRYPVHAVHLAGEIDFLTFASDYRENFLDVKSQLPPHRDHVLLVLEDGSEDQDLLRCDPKQDDMQRERGAFMVIYRYGSVIFINMPRQVREEHLQLLKPYVKVPKGQTSQATQNFSGLRSDETTIVVRSNLGDWSRLEPDKIVVQTLDLGNTRVISHVLGQSVALDHFNSRVDAAIQQFTPYLTAVAQTGQCDTVKEAGLLQLIADNSLLYTDVVTKIGLLDISQTAWKQDKHYELWEALRVDYEIERRFDAINRKLGPMLENAKFLLDVRAEQKSSSAEWIIIGLIMLEVLMNGFGHLATFMWHS